MKTILISILLMVFFKTCFAQPIPPDSLYLAQSRPGYSPVIFQLTMASGLRPVERITVSSDGKEIYYTLLNNWPASITRINCYKYVGNSWQGPTVAFEGFGCPALSVNDSTMYMQKDTNGAGCTYYAVRTGTGWSTPVRLLKSSLQSHYFQETQLKNYYLASNPGGNSDICKLSIHNSDTTIQSLGKPINTSTTENDFFIARDESYIIFFRLEPPYDLFISYHKTNGKWTNPKSLGPNINTGIYECCPFVTNDNKYLFFTRGASAMNSYSTYWVKIGEKIDSLRHTNFIPYMNTQIANQSDSVGKLFNYTFPDSTFIDDDGNSTLRYSATLSNGSPLPSWLTFDSLNRNFRGTPVTAGALGIKVVASDTANATASCIFTLQIQNSVSVNPINENITQYKLYQNYPNPFNPGTTVSYSLLNNSHVSLKVYDLLGREIAVLVNSYQKQGLYDINVNMNNYNLSSGTYIYILSVTDNNKNNVYRETKIMNYIK
ncbi:MAG: putative Ig domain-containing protein [Ignavibacteria bacterium]|nr:putative Ig domain-containing protein [Ignavibacteria bacterium]